MLKVPPFSDEEEYSAIFCSIISFKAFYMLAWVPLFNSSWMRVFPFKLVKASEPTIFSISSLR